MKILILLVAASVQVHSAELPFGKYFFPGDPPKLVPGVMQIRGHYLESELPPMALPPNFRQMQTLRSNLTRSPANRKTGNGGTQARFADRRNFGLPPFGQTSTYLYAEPPLCVACTCLQEYKSCADVGGIQLITVQTDPNGDYYVPTLVTDGLTCSQSTDFDYYSASDITTVTCISQPPASLSACDVACRSNSDDCRSSPSSDNCPQVTPPPVCGTSCAKSRIGMPVPCSPTAFGVISERPTTACKVLKKRETNDSLPASGNSDTPQLESSIGKPSQSASGRAFIAAVITKRVPGKVTATYVATAGAPCLPSNILASPNCKL